MKISEELFWNADYAFLAKVLADKVAYDRYMAYMAQKEVRGWQGKQKPR